MGYRRGRVGFPDWTSTVGKMRAAQDEPGSNAVQVSCTDCKQWREVDLDALIAAKGAAFSLVNKRGRCRLTPKCPGWNRFHYQHGVMRPLWTEDQAGRWIEIDDHARQRLAAARAFVAAALRGELVRYDRAPMGIDQNAWAVADDRERRRLIRQARG